MQSGVVRLRLCALVLVALLAPAGCSSATGGSDQAIVVESEQAEAHDEFVFGAAELSQSFDHVEGYAQSGVLPAALGATRAGFLIDAQEGLSVAPPALEVRGVRDDGTTTEWVPVDVTFQEGPHAVARAELGEQVSGTQFRLPIDQTDAVAQLSYAAVIPEELESAGDGEPVNQAQSALSADLVGLVQPRSAWNARPTKCSGNDKAKYRMAIHHTFTGATSSSGYEARLRSIQAYHMDTRGWCDVGYHFLITQDGRIWEARPIQHTGAHVSNNNSGNIGISWVGCFEPGACASISPTIEPPQAMLDAGASIIKKLAKLYGIAITPTVIKGHGSHSGASTDCPGKNLANHIPAMLDAAKASTTPAPAPPPATSVGRAVGVVWDLSTGASPSTTGAKRVTNATISVDGGAPQPVRATDAYWQLDLAPGSHTLTAAAPGFGSAKSTIDVVSNQTLWASIGIMPAISETEVVVTLKDAGAQKLSNGIVYAPGFGASRAGADGLVRIKLPAGKRELQAFHDGFAGTTSEVTVLAAASQAVAIALAASTPPATKGRVQGVVWDESITSAPSSSGNKRLDHAIVICSCGQAKKARAGDAYWSFDAAPGSYAITVVATGYASESVQSSITTGGSLWSSVGLLPGK